MRLRQCRICGETFETDKTDSTLCPACLAKEKKSTIRDRVCRQCGVTFPGGPRAWYCPNCRQQRYRESKAKYQKRGPERPIGSTDKCSIFGKEYIVNAGRQRYCPDCAPAAIRENDRAASRQYALENNGRKQELRAANLKICVVCGEPFASSTPTVTCSQKCAAIHKKEIQKKHDAKRSPRKEKGVS